MKILVISSCTGKKLHKPENELTQSDFQDPKKLEAKSKKLGQYACSAENMYTGDQHLRLVKGLQALRTNKLDVGLWIVSAGYGLIPGDRSIVPYECTFDTMKAKEIDEWAKFLKIPDGFRAILSDYDMGIVLLGQKYLRSLQLKKDEEFPLPLIFFCSNEKEIKGSKGVVFPTGVRETKDFHCGLVGLKGEIFRLWAEYVANDGKVLPKLVKKPEEIIKILEKLRSQVSSQQDGKDKKKQKKPSRSSKVSPSQEELPQGYAHSKDCPPELILGKPQDYKPPERINVAYRPRKNAKMIYFIPEWDDLVDPNYDFVNDYHHSERFGVKHDAYRDDYFAHELMGRYNYDGILISKFKIEESRKKKLSLEKLGAHAHVRSPRSVPIMGDCGAFGYIEEYEPPYTTEEIIDYYQRHDFDYGVIIDHLIVPNICKKTTYWQEQKKGGYREIPQESFEKKSKQENKYRVVTSPSNSQDLFDNRYAIYQKEEFDPNEAKRRWQITLDNGREFMKLYKKGSYTFHPVASCQGWDEESYTEIFKEFQEMGYNYIALGGLVRSPTEFILKILESIDKIRKPGIKIHLFGIGRLEPVSKFIELGVYSCDSASHLRRAWLGTGSNYWATAQDKYSAIRVPPVRGHNARIKQMLREGKGTLEEFQSLESKVRQALWDFDKGQLSVDETLEIILEYDKLIGENRDRHQDLYREVLETTPWKKCKCPLCKKHGIEIMIFRRNNRNRRRGFHNTYVFFEEFKRLTK